MQLLTLSHLKNKFSSYDKMKSSPVFLRNREKLCFFKKIKNNRSQTYSIRGFGTEQSTEGFLTQTLIFSAHEPNALELCLGQEGARTGKQATIFAP